MAAPEDWIGQEVVVEVSFSGGAPYLGTLEALDEYGITLRHEMEDAARATGGVRSVLYPWTVVHWIYPSEEPSERRRPRPSSMAAEIPENPLP